MAQKRVLITGSDFFINRHHGLFEEMSEYLDSVDYISSKHRTIIDKMELAIKSSFFAFIHSIIIRDIPLSSVFDNSKFIKNFQKSSLAFLTKSYQTERKIYELDYSPDLIFQVFCLSAPLWQKIEIPYVYYLDYTGELARKMWAPWCPLDSEYDDWLNCEQRAYQNARHLFSMSELVKTSLIQDYRIDPNKITVVGSSGNFLKPYRGEKKFGSKKILFNGSDFVRKNGDLVLAAFRIVKEKLPDAELVIIGRKVAIEDEGVSNPGAISRSELQNLFLETDLLVAPAHCDPFPGLLIEAMNYGVPCIVSAADGMPEIVDHNSTGIVISQPNSEILAHEILDLIQDSSRLEFMSHNARQKVLDKLNWKSIAQKILEVLFDIE